MTLAGRIREAAKQLKEFSNKDLSDAVGVRSYQERGAVRKRVSAFLTRGEIERIDRGVYRYVGRKERVTLQQRIWDIARRMAQFTLDDLEQITGANRATIKKFCSLMVKEGYAGRIKQGHFKVIGRLGPVALRNRDKTEIS